MKRIGAAVILIFVFLAFFVFLVTRACAGADGGAGCFAPFAFANPMAISLILPATAAYYLLALLLVNGV